MVFEKLLITTVRALADQTQRKNYTSSFHFRSFRINLNSQKDGIFYFLCFGIPRFTGLFDAQAKIWAQESFAKEALCHKICSCKMPKMKKYTCWRNFAGTKTQEFRD